MTFYQFLIILLARKKTILAVFFLIVVSTFVLNLFLPKTYQASTALIVNYKAMDPITGRMMPAQLIPGYMATQKDIIMSRKVALKVVNDLGLYQSQSAIDSFNEATNGFGDIKMWLAKILLNNLEVEPSRSSSVISLSYEGADPQFVAAVVNAFAESYIQTNVALKVEPAVRTSAWFNEQIKYLRDNLAEAQTKLSTYQKDNGIVSVDERVDVETARLTQLSTQLVSAEAESYDSMLRQAEASDIANIQQSPDILRNPLIQSMKADLSKAEANLAEIRQRLNTNHPSYQSAQAEVRDLRRKLAIELNTVTQSLTSAASISEQRVKELTVALENQKQRVLRINQQRDEMRILQQDVTSAQSALDIALQRFSQTSMEGRANQSDISVLNSAIPPSSPSGPKVFLNMILSIFMGGVISVGVALLAEMLNRHIRSEDDITSILNIPVLGTLNHSVDKGSWISKVFK